MRPASQMNITELSAALAADLAAEIYPQDVIFNNHGISPEAGEELLSQPWFAAMVAQAKRDWDALDNVKDRIRIKAQITLEEAIPTMYGLISDKNTPGAARVAAFKEMKEIAGMGMKEGAEGGAGFIPIQIFLDGRDKPPMVINPGGLPEGNEGATDAEELGEEFEEGYQPLITENFHENPEKLKPDQVINAPLDLQNGQNNKKVTVQSTNDQLKEENSVSFGAFDDDYNYDLSSGDFLAAWNRKP